MAKIKVTKQKSAINRTKRQKLTLEALGLKKIGQTIYNFQFDEKKISLFLKKELINQNLN